MYFHSYEFLLYFMPFTLIGFAQIRVKGNYYVEVGFLTLASLVFYGWLNPANLIYLLLSLTFSYMIGKRLRFEQKKSSKLYRQDNKSNEGMKSGKRQKALLAFGIVVILVLLLLFKYYDFFTGMILKESASKGKLLQFVMPLAISFVTFQQISYLVDVYRREAVEDTFPEYLLYMTFFPQMIQGPIVRENQFLPMFRESFSKKPEYDTMLKGFYGFILGLAKKMLIADQLKIYVDYGYTHYGMITTASTWVLMIGFALQLYFDFSGYCDMAYGLGLLFGVRLPQNFNSPYQATSIADFWDRWHITLTNFFTRYVYIPLGGSRKGKIRTYCNVLLIFFLSGLWHGANDTFLFWGMMHGVAMVLYRMGRKLYDCIPKYIRMFLTFAYTVLAFAMFRSVDVEEGLILYKGAFFGERGGVDPNYALQYSETLIGKVMNKLLGVLPFQVSTTAVFLIILLILLLFVFFGRNTQEKMEKFEPTLMRTVSMVFLFTLCVLSLGKVTGFLYVNF